MSSPSDLAEDLAYRAFVYSKVAPLLNKIMTDMVQEKPYDVVSQTAKETAKIKGNLRG